MNTEKRRAFTLIELLVVIAIIAIMTAAVVPMVTAVNDRSRVGECDGMTNHGAINSPIPYNDSRSAFNGVHREFYFNNTTIVNPGTQTLWYTDPFGNGATAGTGPGTIQQYISTVDNRKRTESGFISGSGRSYPLESVAIGKDRWYGGAGVHAPN